MKQHTFEVVFILVNAGFSDVVMDAAREVGARGGTIIHARGTGNKDMEKKYGVIITPDKELIMILVSQRIRDVVLSAVNKAAGLSTAGQGIAFVLPVEEVAGLKFDSDDKKEEVPAEEK